MEPVNRRTVSGQIALAVLFIVGANVWCFAQSTVSGAIGGVITDPSGGAVPAVTITTVNVRTSIEAKGSADDNGRYLISNLPPGVYTVEINAQSFAGEKRENVIVGVGRVTT